MARQQSAYLESTEVFGVGFQQSERDTCHAQTSIDHSGLNVLTNRVCVTGSVVCDTAQRQGRRAALSSPDDALPHCKTAQRRFAECRHRDVTSGPAAFSRLLVCHPQLR
jgi:hypothetical protein